MMKINDFCRLYKISRYRLAECLDIERKDDESDAHYQKRKTERVRRREGLGWDIMYVDGVVTMRAPNGGKHEYSAGELDDFISLS